jgi:hypothetical protein
LDTLAVAILGRACRTTTEECVEVLADFSASNSKLEILHQASFSTRLSLLLSIHSFQLKFVGAFTNILHYYIDTDLDLDEHDGVW